MLFSIFVLSFAAAFSKEVGDAIRDILGGV